MDHHVNSSDYAPNSMIRGLHDALSVTRSINEPSSRDSDALGSNIEGAEGSTVVNTANTYRSLLDWLEQGFSVARDVSEATPVLAPLKAACAVMIRGINIARVSEDTFLFYSHH